VIDVTGNWYLPFLMSMGLLLLGGFSAFLMHPETPFEEGERRCVGGAPHRGGIKRTSSHAVIPGDPMLNVRRRFLCRSGIFFDRRSLRAAILRSAFRTKRRVCFHSLHRAAARSRLL